MSTGDGEFSVVVGSYTISDDIVINHNVTYDDHVSITGTLTVNASKTFGEGAASKNLTVSGAVQVNGTLDLDRSSSDGNASFGSLTIANTGTVEAPSHGTITILGSSGGFALLDEGTFTHNGGTVKIDFETSNLNSSTRIHQNGAKKLNNVEIEMNRTTDEVLWSVASGTSQGIAGNLTLTKGESYLYSLAHDFDVDGNFLVDANGTWGSLGHTGSHDAGSLTINSGGEYMATSGTTTITSEASSGYAWNRIDGGTFTDNDGTVTIGDGSTAIGGTHIRETRFHHLIINRDASSTNTLWRDVSGNTLTIDGDFTITKGTFFRNTAADTLTVTGDVSVGATGKLGDGSESGTNNFGSLTIASGGTFIATSGTTTITAENLDAGVGSGAGFAWDNLGTFTHNNGKVVIDTAGNNHTLVKETTFYDLEVNQTSSTYEAKFRPKTGTHSEILNNFTLTSGIYEMHADGDTLDIYGLTTIEADGQFLKDAEHTGLVTHHGLVTNRGNYKIKDGVTVKLNGGIRNLGTITVA